MKKVIFLVAFLYVPVLFSQQTLIPDPNFEQALIDLGYDSGTVDGVVLTANIETVIDLDVENRGISDLTGIEDFTALTRLHCPLNNISALNIMQNIALEYLNCYGNQLTSLDISQNTNLLDLLCYNNSITNLDLSNNLVLRQLNTSNNGHSTLDVSFNTDLTSLIASTNNLTSIDVSQNTLLESLNIRSNNLTVIDVSQNMVLDQLTCGDNPLTNLEITQNTVLRRLSIFETAISSLNTSQNALLEELDITSSTVTSLNLSQNTALTTLQIAANQLIDIDVSQNTSLENLNVGGNQLSSLDVSQNTALTNLNCEANDISSLNLSQNIFLTELICRNNELTDLDVSQNSVLSLLFCNRNMLTTLDLNQNTVLTQLNCDNNELTALDVSNNTSLIELQCSFNQLTNLDVSSNVNLELLRCNNNRLNNLNIKNGNNTNIDGQFGFSAINNSGLDCIEVDDAAYSTANWTAIDPFANYSEDCPFNDGLTFVPDDNFEQALIDLNYDSGPLDDHVFTEDIRLITSLIVNNKNISDLTGIEDFLSLTILNVSNNVLTNLEISQNLALENLFCDSNQLTSLEVSANTALESLNCGFNQLTVLNLSANTVLDQLNTTSNQLTSLDLGNNAALFQIRCSFNELTSLNVKNGNNSNISDVNFSASFNPSLECIQVDNVAYSIANWSQIDLQSEFNEDCSSVTNSTFVPDDNFEQALIDLGYDSGPLDNLVPTANINTLASLSINNRGIADLTGIEDFVALQLLSCGNNQLSTVDLSSNTALVGVFFSNNELVSFNLKNGNTTAFEDIFTSNNPNLLCIEVDDPAYATTNLSDNIDAQTTFSDDCTVALTFIPDDNFELTLIDLGYDVGPLDNHVPTANINTVTSLGLGDKAIADLTGIEDFTALTTLFAYNNSLTSIDVSQNLALEYLDVFGNQLTVLDLDQNVQLNFLSCSQNQLSSLDLSQLALLTDLTCSRNQLTSLNVQNGNNINFTSFGATENPNLSCIQVDDAAYSGANWNFIDSGTVFSVDCVTLSDLTYVPDNNFELVLIDLGRDSGPLNDYVPTANINTVTSLGLGDKAIADLTGIEDFTALTTLFAYNNSLTSIDVSQNLALEYLDVFDNQLTVLDLDQNVQLNFLSCSQNQLSSLDLSQLALLTDLTCSRNQLTSLNVQNGNNINFTSFGATENPNLSCIQVDDAAYSGANWNFIDSGTVFSVDCVTLSDLTYVPDNNFELALIDLGRDSGPLNDYVPTANINTVTSLGLGDKAIANLTGIEDFTALTTLFAYNNSLTSIDVSQNLALEYLDVFGNQLTVLDLDQNVQLNFLSCSQNQLSSLDLSQLALLTDLTCSRNQLTSLNVQNGNNINFTSFGATENPNLSCIQVDDAAYSGANWNFIDPQTSFSEDCSAPVGQTYVPDDNFEQALIDLGYDSGALDDFVPTANIEMVLDLDISTNSIADLTGIEDFIALTTLNSSGNALTILEVSQNTALTTLYASDNFLTDIDLSQNSTLVTLDIHNNQLTDLDLSQNTQLVSLACYQNQLSVLNVSQLPLLGEFSADSNQLNSLNIKNGNNIGILYFSAVNNPNLSCIEVDDTTYSTTNWTNIDVQTSFSEDCSVVVDMTFVPDDNFEQALIDLGYDSGPLDDFVPTNNINTVATLVVVNKGINDLTGIEDFNALSLLNCANNNLTSLDLSQNGLLTELFCNQNQLNNLDLSQNTALISLHCQQNQLNNLDISQNEELAVLYCDRNELTSLDVTQNTLLSDLRCSINQLSSLDVRQNTMLTGLQCFTNQISGLDLTQNLELTSLLCGLNQLTSLDVSQNVVLTSLLCDNNLLTNLNVRNGNSANFTDFRTVGNPNLLCVQVDNVNYSTVNWTDIDAQTSFSENCEDTTAPVITLNGANPQTIELGAGYTELGATTDDDSTIVINPSEYMDAIGSYTIYYDAVDGNGNSAIQVTRTVNVVQSDTTAPIITLNGANPQIIELGAGYTELGATTDDGSAVTIDASEFMDEVEKYFIRYNATDSSGNVAIEVVRIVEVIDTTSPVITLNGVNPQTIELGAGYTELGATTDDGSPVQIDASEFMDVVGSYTIFYNATDASGNIAIQVSRTVNVVESDTTAPIITLNGVNPQTIELGAGYTELGATTDDGSPVQIDASEFMDVVGSYTIFYNATDASGNIAIQVSRTVNVVESDTTAPIITLNGANPQTIELGAGYTELGATADDGSEVVIDADEFMDIVGIYTIYYNATDTNGNVAIEVLRTVEVVHSTIELIAAKGFSPNGDTIADTWVIENIESFGTHRVTVYNRWGSKVFEAFNYRNDWDGSSRNTSVNKLPVGPYLYLIEFADPEIPAKQGWVYINY